MGYQANIKCLLCECRSIGRKLCRKHYMQMLRRGELDKFQVLQSTDSFHARYKKIETGCWEWQGTTNDYGYGVFLLPGEKPIRAHRFSYEQIHGPIPHGCIIMHTCDNPPCVNPDHLRLGTKADNNRDTAIKRRHHYGTDHWNGRLTDEQVKDIRASTERQSVLAKHYKISQSYVSWLKSGKVRVLSVTAIAPP